MLWWCWMLIIAALLLIIALMVGALAFHYGFTWDRDNDAIEELNLKRLAEGPLQDYAPAVRAARQAAREWPAETVHITSEDGLRLQARLIQARPDAPSQRGVMLLAHGFRSSGPFDFSLALPCYLEQGFDLLLLDQRAHGESEGRYICFGVRESSDAAAWSRFLAARYADRPIVLTGLSMGATSVLLAAGRSDLADSVCGVVADCGFSSCKHEFRYFIRHFLHLPVFPLYHLAELACRVRLGFGFDQYRTEEALARTQLPLLLIHGEDDDFVPPDNSRRSFGGAAAADKTLLIVPGAGHGQSFLADSARYRRELDAFLQRVAPPVS